MIKNELQYSITKKWAASLPTPFKYWASSMKARAWIP